MSLTLSLLLALASAQDATPAPPAKDVPIPAKIPSPSAPENEPTVNIRTGSNGDVIEEYRQGGRITMVRITPKHGKPYYLYDDDGNGRLDRSDIGRHDVSPVYWEIYSWD